MQKWACKKRTAFALKVIVVGGGISGLAAAHRLTELSREKKLGLSVTLLEKERRLGGLLETREQDGFLMEGGADAFLTESPWALDLCRRAGLEKELTGTNPSKRRSFILHRGKLVPVPEGFHLVAPSTWQALWKAPALSLLGKLRMALEPLVPAKHDDADESAAAFIRRRFGPETLERIGKPMVGGIYTADLELLSAQAALPRLCEMERRYGSVIHGLRAGPAAAGKGTAGPRYGLFMTLKGGLSRLVEALAARLPPGAVRSGAGAASIARRPSTSSGQTGGWAVTLENGETLEADAVVLALPAHLAAGIARAAAPALSAALAAIPYESAVIVNLAFRAQDLPALPEGFGLVVADPKNPAVGCTFSSVKFPARAPEGTLLLRCFLGGALHRGVEDADDREIQSLAMDPVRKGLGVKAEPLSVWIRRHRKVMPQYHVGHHERVLAIEKELRGLEGLHLTGNGYRGLGIPDCIHQAERAAEEVCAGV